MEILNIREIRRVAEEFQFIGKCKACKLARKTTVRVRQVQIPHETMPDVFPPRWHDVFVTEDGTLNLAHLGTWTEKLFFETCACGGRRKMNAVRGTVNMNKGCDGRCMAATGPNCDCACGGANHGANH